ncbi:hypothetical protein BJP37_03680 [Moorena bouillonii PNG]|uniref:Uncharacterized protein n=1 Tax=Moorena bouillonii PNG TaxID=568701 RepID=A0A1U7MX49_9CYAN|nr:hypothetical protein BJP37_03680 [Moorena bouillonii PNG]
MREFRMRESGIGNRESGIGNWESGIGSRESGVGKNPGSAVQFLTLAPETLTRPTPTSLHLYQYHQKIKGVFCYYWELNKIKAQIYPKPAL